jgi:hypothetical protein
MGVMSVIWKRMVGVVYFLFTLVMLFIMDVIWILTIRWLFGSSVD